MTATYVHHLQDTSPDGGLGPQQNRLVPLPGQASTAELLGLLGMQHMPHRTEGLGVDIGLWRIRPEAVLLHEGTHGDTIYVLRSGSLKCVKTLEDGYEQVLSFAQPGELLGYDALHGGTRPSTVVALEYSTVYALPVHGLTQCSPLLDEALRRGLSRQLARAAETAEMMAAVTSDVRLTRFILWMSGRMAEAGQSPRRLRLRMCRRDIASLLGVAHETVSRSFTTLADLNYIRVDNREIEILDLEALCTRARCTRGLPLDELHGAATGVGARTGDAPTHRAIPTPTPQPLPARRPAATRPPAWFPQPGALVHA